MGLMQSKPCSIGEVRSRRRDASTSVSCASVTIKKKKHIRSPTREKNKCRHAQPLCDDNDVTTSLVGSTVQVCWDSAQTCWYDCTVMREENGDYDEAKLFVKYNDGISEWVHRDDVRVVKGDKLFYTPPSSASSPQPTPWPSYRSSIVFYREAQTLAHIYSVKH